MEASCDLENVVPRLERIEEEMKTGSRNRNEWSDERLWPVLRCAFVLHSFLRDLGRDWFFRLCLIEFQYVEMNCLNSEKSRSWNC